VRGEDNMAHELQERRMSVAFRGEIGEDYIDGHVAVDAIVSELVSHDPPCGISNQDIDPVGALCYLVGHGFDSGPVGHVALEPGDLLCSFLSHLLADGFQGILDDLFGHGEDIDMFDVLFEKGMGASIADSYTGSALSWDLDSRDNHLVSLQLRQLPCRSGRGPPRD